MTTNKTELPSQGKALALVLAVILVVWFNTKSCKSENDKYDAAQAATMPVVPTLNDTLAKSELRAVVFLKLEYGVQREDIDLAVQSWYPAQKMEVCKWRIRSGGQHMMVVTQTKLVGSDMNSFDAYHTWDVKVVNKYSE